MNLESFTSLKRAHNFTQSTHGLAAQVDDEKLRVDVLNHEVVRIKISRGGEFDEHPTFALAREPKLTSLGFKVETGNGVTTLATDALELVIHHEPFAINVYRKDGSVVFENLVTYARQANSFVIRRKVGEHDPIYGLGEKTGSFNRRGRDFTLWNTDILNPNAAGAFTKQYAESDPRSDATSTEFDPYYVSIPFIYHQDARTGEISGSFIDNGYQAKYDFTAKDEISIRFDGGQYTEYVFAGKTMAQNLKHYTDLTGRTQLPPLWALGFHQCRWYAYEQKDVERMVATFKELDVPLDAFWLDIDYMDGYRVFTWNTDRYPDVEGMLSRLKEQGVKVITIIDPGVKEDPGYAVYDDGVAKNIFAQTPEGDEYIGQVWPGRTAFPDFANEDARKWWGKLNAEHVKSGLAGIWNDMNEPATGDVDPMAMRHDRGRFEHERYHNSYALLMAMGTVEGLREAMPELRTFVLSRAGSAGIQRYAANWMGDNMSRWNHLWLSIPMGNGLSISGQSFVGADIGGFAEDTTPELYARWVSYGMLTPFARVHSVINTIDQYAWSFGEEILGMFRKSAKLRYRLLPYIYSAFVQASETAAPIQGPLIYDFQSDIEVRDIDDQYMFGRNLMVAPIFVAEHDSRMVYLPAGEWYDFNSGAYHLSKGEAIKVASPLGTIPIFARAGAVVPMLDKAPQNTDGLAPEVIELHVYLPSQDGTYHSMLQEDDGLTFDALSDKHVRTEFTVKHHSGKTNLTAKVSGQGFKQFARKQFVIVAHSPEGEKRHTINNAGVAFEVEL